MSLYITNINYEKKYKNKNLSFCISFNTIFFIYQ